MSPKYKINRPGITPERFLRARDESRTHTSQLTLAPETSASTIPPPAHYRTAKIRIVLKTAKVFFRRKQGWLGLELTSSEPPSIRAGQPGHGLLSHLAGRRDDWIDV